jgi:hypothetical protein
MDPKTFYGKRKEKKHEDTVVRSICGYESEYSVFASDTEDDTQIADNVQIKEMIPESDDDSAEDGDNDHTRNDRNEQSDDEGTSDEAEINTEVIFNWKRVTNRCTNPIQPCRGNLPPASKVPHAPVEYFTQLLDNTILDNATYPSNPTTNFVAKSR